MPDGPMPEVGDPMVMVPLTASLLKPFGRWHIELNPLGVNGV